jgi:HSP20 family protein
MFELTPYARGNHSFAAYNPFKEMEDFEKHFFGRQLPAFKTDIRETENAYILDAELPGFSKEDIHAEVRNGYLTIHAEHKSENEEKDEKNNYIRRERSYGSFSRSFDLEGIKSDEITASYKDGVLSLTLPKEETKQTEGRRLEIQ